MNQDLSRLGVFQVLTGGGTGSGFLVDQNHLLTNCHVVAPYRSVAVELRDRRRILGTVRRIHPKRDLAMVELASPLDCEVLAIEALDGLAPKQQVYIIGFPVGLPLSVTEGVVSNPKQLVAGQHFVQTDAAINPGNSGGPILNQEKHVVAVTTCKFDSAELVGFGIPAADVRDFVERAREQTVPFGVVCPACDALLETNERYCESCGMDLEPFEIAGYFDPPENHPIVAFVEGALERAGIDPILTRHGEHNWSFHSGSAPIKIWCCCSEHLCFSSPLAQVGKQGLGELFRFLLSPEHDPFSFDLDENVIRLNLTFHVSDVFGRDDHGAESTAIARFVEAADAYDNLLIEKYGCEPAPETQLTFLKEPSR